MTQHCNVFICKVLKSLRDSIVQHCYAGTAEEFSAKGSNPTVEQCPGQRKLGLLDYARVSTAISVLGWGGGAQTSCPWVEPPAARPGCILVCMFCQDWPPPSRGYTFFLGYMQLQALCAPYKRGKPSGTMTKQTGLIPVTLFWFLSPARCCLPALVSPSLACKILKWFRLECVPPTSPTSPLPYHNIPPYGQR